MSKGGIAPTGAPDWLHVLLSGWNIPPDSNAERFDHLRRLIAADGVPQKIRFSAMRHLAYGLRATGNKAAAVPPLEALLDQDESNQRLHRYQLGITYRDLNRFRAVAAIADELGDDERNGYAERLRASLDAAHGKVHAAIGPYHARADRLAAKGDARVSLEQRIGAYFIQAFVDPSVAAICDELQGKAEAQVAPSSIYQALGAQALCISATTRRCHVSPGSNSDGSGCSGAILTRSTSSFPRAFTVPSRATPKALPSSSTGSPCPEGAPVVLVRRHERPSPGGRRHATATHRG